MGNDLKVRIHKFSHPRNGAFALVAVLLVLMLLAGMVLVFFSLATHERKASAIFKGNADAEELARLGADMVISQIRAATTQKDTSWASQPGAIRTYGLNATYSALDATGSRPDTVYKLYSSANMTQPGNVFNATAEVPPQNWDAQPGIFVDLNAPAISTTANGSTRLNFPIIDPRAFTTSNITSVQGFSYNSSINGTVLPTSSNGDDTQRLPMPARWLYVLKDGTMVAPTSQTGEVVKVPGASSSNPVTGRVAFWTDDETAKININTAGGDVWKRPDPYYAGSYWSPPYAHSEFDQKKLAMAQPYQREYQRYPGHPGTVHLSAVFPDLSLSEILSLTPRYRFGGSEGGRIDLNTTVNNTIEPKTNRLYASVDEVIYNTERKAISTIDESRLEKSRFFLTANSRASDLNLFGLPKVSAWPIHRRTGSQYRTPFDETIAFCTTAKDYKYFFTRNQANDPQGDFNSRNSEIYDYLVNLIGRRIPGYGGGASNQTLSIKWGAADKQILTQVYDYIRSTNLADTSTPSILPYAMETPSKSFGLESLGFGQVVPTRIQKNGTSGFGRYPVISELGFLITRIADDSPDLANALSQFPTKQSNVERRWYRAIILIELFSPSQGMHPLGLNMNLEFSNLSSFKISSNSSNMTLYGPNGTATPSNQIQVFPKDEETLLLQQYSGRGVINPGNAYYPRGFGGMASPFSLLYKQNTANATSNLLKDFVNGQIGPDIYPLVSPPFCIDQTGNFTTSNSTSANITTSCRFDGFSPIVTQRDPLNQYPIVYNFSFPIINSFSLTNNANKDEFTSSLNSKLSPRNPYDYLSRNGTDRLRTVSLSKNSTCQGDVRQIYGQSNVLPSDYTIGLNYSSSQTQHSLIHNFQGGDNFRWGMGALGDRSYFTVGAGAGTAISSRPNAVDLISVTVKPNLVGLKNPTNLSVMLEGLGDWDTGIGVFNDGPYINKPDDGTISIETRVTGEAGFYTEPYFRNLSLGMLDPNYFSPNRIMPSPIMFGSLPTGVGRGLPWQTLLFTPGPAAGLQHPGFLSGPPDHLLVDLFHIPVVDPYAISEPFSTSGRVNLNTQVLPFNYVSRDTALQAAFRGIRVPVISGDDLGGAQGGGTTASPASLSNWIKTDPYLYKATFSGSVGGSASLTANTSTNSYIYHRPIDLETTIDGFRKRMDSDNLFRSATEICDMFLVPDLRNSAGDHFLNSGLANPAPNINTGTYDSTALRDFWTASGKGLKWSGLTGDNLRERPYALLYPLVTTKSNSFTVHVVAQALKNPPAANAAGEFLDKPDSVQAEWRGSFLLERQLDQNNPQLVDYTKSGNQNPPPENHPEQLHKIRILQTRKFTSVQ
jgi:uncharacterized protein (TIGR02600 family)